MLRTLIVARLRPTRNVGNSTKPLIFYLLLANRAYGGVQIGSVLANQLANRNGVLVSAPCE